MQINNLIMIKANIFDFYVPGTLCMLIYSWLTATLWGGTVIIPFEIWESLRWERICPGDSMWWNWGQLTPELAICFSSSNAPEIANYSVIANNAFYDVNENYMVLRTNIKNNQWNHWGENVNITEI